VLKKLKKKIYLKKIYKYCSFTEKTPSELIEEAENESRGYYTGVFGIFDGSNLESAVMIRFIENRNGQLFYHSGGGITVNSICENEFQARIWIIGKSSR